VRLLADQAQLEALSAAGLDAPAGWSRALGDGVAAGRGVTSTVELATGLVARLKQLRRGGLARHVWHERFPGASRLVRNVEIPLEAIRRGIPTARPVALLLVAGPPGLNRGWLATEEIPDVEDLAARVRTGRPPDEAEIAAVMSAVRAMHDRGLDHSDLNLGNLLLRSRDGNAEVFVIDLDACELQAAPLSFARRQQALRRLERSYVKVAPDPDDALRERNYSAYAAGDAAMAERLARGRRSGRLRIFLHRLSR
jgi:hypothetical protein